MAKRSKRLRGHAIACPGILALAGEDALRGTVLDPARRDLGHEGSRHPRGPPDAGGDARTEGGRGHDEADAQAGREHLGRAGDVDARCPGANVESGRTGLRQQAPVHVVLHDQHAVLARDGGDLLPALHRHHRRRRVLQRGHAVEGLGPAGAAGGGEGVRAQSVLVHGHALQAQREQAGQRLHSRVGERFRGHHVAGREERREHGRHPVLAAAGHEDAVGG